MLFCNPEKELAKLDSLIKVETVLNATSDAEKKALTMALLEDLTEGTTSDIDREMAELILKSVIKSTGNNITAFLVRDK